MSQDEISTRHLEATLSDVLDALRLTVENYPPCDQCGAIAAEWWRWVDRGYEEGPDMTAYCEACVGDLSCEPAEPAEHIAALAKVRHLFRGSPT